MDEIITERSDGILRVELNRPSRKNAMTSGMYIDLADIFNDAARDASTRVVLWHGAGDSFCAGNDIEDFLKNPPGPGKSPQARLENAFVDFDKPLVAAVQGAAIGGGTTMLTHCDFVLAGRSAQFRMPFVDLAVVPEFGSSWSVPAQDRTPPRGRAAPAGAAVRCRTGSAAGPRYAGRRRSNPVADRDRNRPRAGGQAGGSAAGQQETHEARRSGADQSGDEGRERGVQPPGALRRGKGSAYQPFSRSGVPRRHSSIPDISSRTPP